ncbi:long-chain acyl-CoA synthetase [Pancytospora epiphaga]|nr:long-chain acyl-CoA synthetase [Pancytospora epiphaga]
MDRRVVLKDGVYSNKAFREGEPEIEDGSRTLLQMLQNRARDYPDGQFLGTIKDGEIHYKTFKEVYESALKLAVFLEGVTADGDIVGLYSINRLEWVIGEYASYLASCSNCPIYSTFPAEAISFILSETELSVIITSADKGASLLNNVLKGDPHKIKHVVLMDEDRELMKEYEKLEIKTYLLSEILGGGEAQPSRAEPSPGDVATICYTSGTLGVPKGVILSHSNFIAAISAFTRNKDSRNYVLFDDKNVYLSYLPLPHVLERICFTIVWCRRARIVFFSGNPKNLQADMKIVKPTFLVTVPRVLNIFMEKIKASIAKRNVVVRFLFNVGLKFKIWRQSRGVYKNWLFDKLIFNKVRKEFGGALEHSLCGGASLSPEVLQFIQAALSVRVFQGYGQSEGLAANIVVPLDCHDVETVGIPFPSVMAKLLPTEEYNDANVGELCMKGPSITRGYFKRPKETSEVLTEDGWLKTGDIARVDNGSFYIIGRVKEIFKTSFGEYIVPERIENLLCGGLIEDIFITNTKFSDFLVSVVVCVEENVSKEDVISCIKKRASACVDDKTMTRYEIPSYFIVTNEPFISLADGSLITPSLKKRRNALNNYFKEKIDEELSKNTVN